MTGRIEEEHDPQKAEERPSPKRPAPSFDLLKNLQVFPSDHNSCNNQADKIAEEGLLKCPHLFRAQFDKYLHDGKGQR
ncbi:Uncharacterised protein [uncultured Blautia sp.]|nr:Uncharacterised protein [uncultured Blautia sp.]